LTSRTSRSTRSHTPYSSGRHQRCWVRHQTITDPAHRETAHQLAHHASALRDNADQTAGAAGQVVVERRNLSIYDTVFGTRASEGEVA
jgi:hypothetical protein